MVITSINNERVNNWLKLKQKKYRDKYHLFIIESENLVNEALKRNIVKEIITIDDRNFDVPTYNVNMQIMKKLSFLESPPKIMAVCEYIVPKEIEGNILILDKVQDPGNLGTIIRSAVAFNFKTIIVSNDTVDFYNDKVIRSSEGMIFNINILKENLLEFIPKLKEKNYLVVGTDVKKGEDVRKLEPSKYAFVIGNEGSGMSKEIKDLCDKFIYIKMNEKAESLNAAIASSIIMYEANYE